MLLVTFAYVLILYCSISSDPWGKDTFCVCVCERWLSLTQKVIYHIKVIFPKIENYKMWQCEFKGIKLCKVKIKLISLGWYLVTMIFWCQINPEIHCSQVMHNVQDKTKSHENLPFSAHLLFSFSWYPCVYLYFSQNQTLSPFLRDISDIVAILPLRYCKSFRDVP